MSDWLDSGVDDLAARLCAAQAPGAAPVEAASLPMPPNADAAYLVQDRIVQLRGGLVGGWKVGAKAPGAPAQGAPLPADRVYASWARLRRADFAVCGLELEIAFRLARDFAPRETAYPDAEVLEAIDTMCATIEIVASRVKGWPDVGAELQLADLQNHGALVVGAELPYRSDFPFAKPAARFRFGGRDIGPATPANAAGDPRALLPWAVNHCTMRGQTFERTSVVTTGTLTGLFLLEGPGSAEGEIAGLPAVRLTVA